VCDAPAKSYILQCRGHTGYFSCTKCTVEGTYKQKRICFPEINASKRTDKDFRMHSDDSYHVLYTLLEKIPDLDFVNDFVLDYMHLVCLDITRKLLYLWINGDTGCRLSHHDIKRISNKLEDLKRYTPRKFVRKPRSLKYVKLWKATEYRQILLYTGPIVLKSVLSKDNYKHFLSLHVAIRILCKEDTKNAYMEYSKKLLEHFVKSFIKLYGKHHVSHNVHGLIHLVDDVKNFGILDNFSAFKFENFMQTLKQFIRKSEKPLQQLFRRYHEMQHVISKKKIMNKKLYPIKVTRHYDGPLLPHTRNPQYKAIECNYFKLDANNIANDCCGLEDNAIILITNIAHCTETGGLMILGYEFKCKQNFYNVPCDSSFFYIYKVSQLSNLKKWPLSAVNIKYAKFPCGNDEFVVIPLLHSEISERIEF